MVVSVSWGPAHEMVLSLLAYLMESRHATLDLGPGWATGLEDRFSPRWHGLVDKIRGDDLPVGFVLARMTADLPEGSREATDLVSAVSDAGPGEINDLLGSGSDSRVADTVHRVLDPLVEGWNCRYFSSLDETVLVELRAEMLRRCRRVQEADPETVIHEATGGLEFMMGPAAPHTVLIPHQHFRPWNLYDRYRGRILCWYPAPYRACGNEDPPRDLLRALKSLADESRLRILGILASQEMSFTELVQRTGLAKSTVHHHIASLRDAGLLGIRVGWEKGDRLRLSPGIPERIRGMLTDYLHEG